ncbi:phosphoribosylformylglycinamidine synthase subunit PurL [Candidatus Micrarchaeota archaeon]|nr:phosphoribosylformylglycinamidine synthase subunit PurL [Candidatus Micrarchaeota archaeon]
MVSGIEVDLTKKELALVKKRLSRDPSPVEAGMIDIMWSEHCSYKTSRPVLKQLPTEGKRVVLGPGFDAGVVDVGDNQCIAFKIESHNHPSAIEPYSGAATGVGGIIRDVLAVGATPIAVLDSLCFGRLDSEHSQWLMNYVVKGIADYGNCVGIPTVAGDTNFDRGFETNCIVNAACVGLVAKDQLILGKARDAGDLLVLVGSLTGRDGIHGVTFASKNLSEKSEGERPAVQIPDPFTKKLIVDATLELLPSGKVKALKDFGGGGLTCCASEMAFKGGKGAKINASAVPLREKDMTAMEIMLSESQERMLYSCAPKDLKHLTNVFDKYGLTHAVIGSFTDEPQFVIEFEGRVVAEIPVDLLTDVPTISMPVKVPEYVKTLAKQKRPPVPENLNHVFMNMLRSDNLASKRWVYQQYDHEVQARTVLKAGDTDAAVLRLTEKKGLALKTDCVYRLSYLDPYSGGAESVLECARNLAAVGAVPVGMVDNLNFGNPNDPAVFWQFSESVRGIADACKMLQIPCVGGNVSFYNEDDRTKEAIKPAPVILLVGVVEDMARITEMRFRNTEDSIVIIGETAPELGGSEYAHSILKWEGGKAPSVDLDREKRTLSIILEANKLRLISSCHDVSSGGFGLALAEMCIRSNMGAEVQLDRLPSKGKLQADEIMFAETPGRFLVASREPQKLLNLAKSRNVKAEIIGKPVLEKRFVLFDSESSRKRVVDCAVTAMRDEFERRIPGCMK